MPAAFNAYQRNFTGIDFLKVDAVPDGDQPVFCAMQYIGMALNPGNPFVGPHPETQYQPHGENRQKPFHHLGKTVIRGIQDKVTGTIIRSQLGSKSASHAPAIHDQVFFGILCFQRVVDELHICQHCRFASFTRALSKAAVVYQDNIIIVTVKILCILAPAFDAPAVSVKIQNESFRVFTVKMEAVDSYTGFYIKEKFTERNIIYIGEVLCKLFRFKDQLFLDQVSNQHQPAVNAPDQQPVYFKQYQEMLNSFGMLASRELCIAATEN